MRDPGVRGRDRMPRRAADAQRTPSVSVVIASAGSPTLTPLVEALAAAADPAPLDLVVVDDRCVPTTPLDVLVGPGRVVPGGGRGPAAARNAGVRETTGEWVVFLDEAAVLTPSWYDDLLRDVAGARPRHAAVQARIRTTEPRPGAPGAPGATVDLAYRRLALRCVGGFEERFPRAGREDVDVVLRALRSGWSIAQGARVSLRESDPGAWQVRHVGGVLGRLRAGLSRVRPVVVRTD